LRLIHTLLKEEAVIEGRPGLGSALAAEPSPRTYRSTPADVVLRMLVLKRLVDWSYDDLEHEVRANL
jgi:hypothetical protein